MSKTQFVTVTDTNSAVPAGCVRKTYQFFNLDTFDNVKETVDIPFTPAKDLAEAHARVGGDESMLLKALNAYLKGEALREAENSVTAKGGKRSVVMAVAKPFRTLPPFSTCFKLDGDGKPIVENGEKVIDRAKQTRQILDMIKSNPTMLEAIKAGSLTESDSDENEGNEDES